MAVVGIAWGAIAGAWGTFAATGLGTFLTTTTFGKLLTSVALSALKTALIGKPKSEQRGLRTSQTLTGGVTAASFLLGVYATEGQLTAPPMTHGNVGKTPNAYLNYVIELGDIAGQTFEGLILEGEKVELGIEPHEDYGTPILGRFTDRAWVNFYDGTQTTADPMLLAKYPAPLVRPWSAGMIGAGIPYAIFTFRFDREVFTNFPSVRIEAGGIPLYDPRKDSTVGGSGLHRWADKSTWEQTENTAVQIYNIMRGIDFGGGNIWGGDADATDLPLDNWWAAMNVCDLPIALADGGSDPQYRTSFEVAASDEPASIIEELLRSVGGNMSESGGVWKIQIGAPALPVYFFDDDDVIISQSEQFEPFSANTDPFNAVQTVYPDPDALWEPRDAPLLTNLEYEAADGDQRNTADLTMNACPYPLQIQRVQNSYLEEERRFRRHVLALPSDALILEPLDTVAWTSARHGYDQKLFEVVTAIDPLITGTPRVSLRERDPSDYSWSSSQQIAVDPVSRGVAQLPAQTVTDFTVGPWTISRADGSPARPGIRLTWDGDQPDVRGIQWEVSYPEGALVIAGSTQAVAAGAVILDNGALLADTNYFVTARFIVDRPTAWTDPIAVRTPDIRLTSIDLAPELALTIADTADAVEAVGQAVGVVEQFALQTQERIEADARARVPADRIIDDSLEQISARITDLLMRVSDTRSTIARAGVYVDEEDGSVKIEGVKSLEGALFETQIAVNEIAGRIGLFASQQFVREEIAAQVLDPSQLPVLDDIIAQVNEVQLVLDAATASLAAKADASTVSTLGARQDQAELEISALDAAIAARALSTEVSAVEARVTSAELELSTLDGAAFDIALRDVRRLSGENEASAVADLAGLLRSYEEGEQRRADLASARLSLSADIDEGRTALAQLEIELAAAIEASEALVLQEAEARADALSAEAIARQDVTARVSDLETDLAQTSAAVTDLATATSDADSALAQRSTSLEARADDLENEAGATSAVLSDLATASANADSALAQRATSLEARATDLEGNVSATAAAVSDLATASADADSALAQRATSLEARAGDLEDGVSATSAAISGLATTTASADSALAQRATNLEARAGDLEDDVSTTSAALSDLATASANADSALAQRATNLEARAGDLEDGVSATSAAINGLATTTASADSALAQRATNLEARAGDLEGDVSATSAALSDLTTASANADSALAQRATNLEARAGGLEDDVSATSAAVSNLTTASANADSALAQRATNLEARADDLEGDVSATSAALSDLATASANADTALAQRSSTLEGTVNNATTGLAATRGRVSTLENTRVTAAGAVSAVTQTISATYGSLDALATATSLAKAGVDGLQAGYLWRARAGGVTGEVELVSNGVASQFVVRSDRLKFEGDLAEFFSDVRITGDLVVEGALTAREIVTDGITKQSLDGWANHSTGGTTAWDAASVVGAFTLTTQFTSNVQGHFGTGLSRTGAELLAQYPAFEIQVLVGGQVVVNLNASSQAFTSSNEQYLQRPFTRQNVSPGSQSIQLRARNVGDTVFNNGQIFASAFQR